MLYELAFSQLGENVSMQRVEPKTYNDNANIRSTQFIQTSIIFGNSILLSETAQHNTIYHR